MLCFLCNLFDKFIESARGSGESKWADPLYCGLTVCNENLSFSFLFSDTDCAVVVTPGKSSREVMRKLEDVMDFSNLPKDVLCSAASNEKSPPTVRARSTS